MPTPLVRPANMQLAFAAAGLKNSLPVAAATLNNASYETGFPSITMLPIAAGGRPPKGKDFNGVLFDITSHTLWVNAGGQYRFDAALAAYIGGYPVGMVLQNNAGTASFVCGTANNSIDFNTTPSSIGVNWLPYSGQSFSNVSIATTGGTTALSAIQAVANFVTVTGVLTSNAVITVPAALAKTTIINNTTGAFTLTVKTAAGTGVTVRQATADAVICDGTNVRYAQSSTVTMIAGDATEAQASTLFVSREVSRVGGFYQDTGAVANAYVVATIPVTGAYVDGQSLRFRTTRVNTGAVTLNAGAGAVAIAQEDGGALQAGDIISITTVTYNASISKWVYNGTAPSDVLDSPALRGVPTTPTAAPLNNSVQVSSTAYADAGDAVVTAHVDASIAAVVLAQNLQYKNASFTAGASGYYWVNTEGGPITVTLPDPPTGANPLIFQDLTGSFGARPMTLNPGSKTILGDSSYVCDVDGETFQMWYDGTDWRFA